MLLLCLFQVHLARRALETGLLMRYSPDDVMHGIAYVFGMRCGPHAGLLLRKGAPGLQP